MISSKPNFCGSLSNFKATLHLIGAAMHVGKLPFPFLCDLTKGENNCAMLMEKSFLNILSPITQPFGNDADTKRVSKSELFCSGQCRFA